MKNFIGIMLILLVGGCSDFDHFESGAIEGYASGEAVHVKNKTDTPVWYMVVERETAATINWVRTKEERNKLVPGVTKEIPLQEVFGYEKGDEILFYYWISTDPQSELYHLVIKTD